jgi:hypothetical protein
MQFSMLKNQVVGWVKHSISRVMLLVFISIGSSSAYAIRSFYCDRQKS